MVIRILICIVFLTTSSSAADPNGLDESEGHTLPEVTVTAPGEYDFTTLPNLSLLKA